MISSGAKKGTSPAKAGPAFTLASLGTAAAAAPPEPLRIQPIGFTGATSVITGMNAAGQVIGDTGGTASLFDGAAVIQIGMNQNDDVYASDKSSVLPQCGGLRAHFRT